MAWRQLLHLITNRRTYHAPHQGGIRDTQASPPSWGWQGCGPHPAAPAPMRVTTSGVKCGCPQHKGVQHSGWPELHERRKQSSVHWDAHRIAGSKGICKIADVPKGKKKKRRGAHARVSKPWVAKADGPSLHLLAQLHHIRVVGQARLEVLQLLALLLLDLQGDLAAAVQELGDLLEVLRGAAAGGHRRRADAHAARRQRGGVAVHGVAIQRDGRELADLLQLRAREPMGPQVPEHQVVVSAVAGELVALGLQRLGQGVSVGHHRLGVLLELGRGHLQELRGQATDLVVVRAALEAGEDRHVDALLDVRHLVTVLEEDHPSPRAAQGLVRGRGDHIAMREGRGVHACGDQAGDVRNVRHEQRAHLICDRAELGEVHDARVGGGTAQDHGRTEHQRRLPELLEVNEAGLRVHLVRQGLEVDRGRRDLLLGCVVAMREVAPAGQVQAHDTRVWWQQASVDGEVCRAAGIWLYVDSPLLLVDAERVQSPLLAQVLHLVDDLIAAIIACSRLTLGILVGQG
mmetsp:Transcript_109442/g.274134  ORF Transcript_109442/g.274134 Transcript_109442/m.274134 type:complete len:517 (+) Transcript_109442:95-1645(+)